MGFEVENGIVKKYTSDEIREFMMMGQKVTYYSPDSERDKELIFPENITGIGYRAFSDIGFGFIDIPKSVTSIGNMAFSKCINLREIILPPDITNIGDCTFDSCESLEIVKIPDKVTSIGKWAFYKCFNLKSIVIPENVTSIGSGAFEMCSSINTITIPDNVKTIGRNAFHKCYGVQYITINGKKSSIKIKVKDFGRGKAEECKFIDFICAEPENKEKVWEKMKSVMYKNPCAVYLAVEYNNENAKTYIKRNINNIIRYLIENDDVGNISEVLKFGYVKEYNINGHIHYAIDQKKPEIQVILSHYKNDNIGFSGGSFDKFIL